MLHQLLLIPIDTKSGMYCFDADILRLGDPLAIGSEEELEQNIEWVRRYQPLTVEEEESLRSQGRQIARQWGPHFGPVDASE